MVSGSATWRVCKLRFSAIHLRNSSSRVLPSASFHSFLPFALPPSTNIAAELGAVRGMEIVSLYVPSAQRTISPFLRAVCRCFSMIGERRFRLLSTHEPFDISKLSPSCTPNASVPFRVVCKVPFIHLYSFSSACIHMLKSTEKEAFFESRKKLMDCKAGGDESVCTREDAVDMRERRYTV